VHKVLAYSLLLILGLIGSQALGDTPPAVHTAITLATMVALAFIMIHVGYEFELDRTRPRQYAWDAFVATTAATFPWLFCTLYFVYAMSPRALWGHGDLWREGLLKGIFAAPTSAGILFSMLAAAGLSATWVFRKARVLAIFDDLSTILLLIPLKVTMVGLRWQLLVVVVVIGSLLWAAWRYLHAVRLPVRWPFVLGYAACVTLLSEVIQLASLKIDPAVPIQVEVLLPSFVLGCLLARPAGTDCHADDAQLDIEPGPEQPTEQRVSTIVSACFMVLVGLSMPPIRAGHAGDAPHVLAYAGAPAEAVAQMHAFPGWGAVAGHVLVVTLLSNLGKLFPVFCYRREATLRERLALSVGMFPRGEVGAGVLVIALSYGLGGPTLTVAVLSLAVNLLLTGAFIVVVKRLIAAPVAEEVEAGAGAGR
jgi:Kef-type K+ transport system membrane component KefB